MARDVLDGGTWNISPQDPRYGALLACISGVGLRDGVRDFVELVQSSEFAGGEAGREQWKLSLHDEGGFIIEMKPDPARGGPSMGKTRLT